MVSTKDALDKFRQKLLAVPHADLVDFVADYCVRDTNLYFHLTVMAGLKSKDQEQAYGLVKDEIDRVFGDEDIECNLEFDQQVPYDSVAQQIAQLLTSGMAEQAARACEHSFQYAVNISNVTWPDTFLQDCYDPIIATWCRAQMELETPTDELLCKVGLLAQNDDYGMFFDIETKLGEILGAETAQAYRQLSKVKQKK